jgi:hypothetical protein
MHRRVLLARTTPIIKNINGNITVFDPTTQLPIPQGPGSDGGGSGFSIPALLWIGFCIVMGIPLTAAGIRGWRLTTGAGVGLSSAVLGM